MRLQPSLFIVNRAQSRSPFTALRRNLSIARSNSRRAERLAEARTVMGDIVAT